MPRFKKFMTPDAAVHTTSNTARGQHLFTPSERFNLRALGSLRKYQKRYDMVIYAYVMLSNHFHLLLQPKNQTQLSDFMRDVKAALARLVQDEHGVTGVVFARRFEQSEDLDDEGLMHDFLYVLANSVAEGLVEDPRHWPGIHCAKELCGDEPMLGEYFDDVAYAAAKAHDRSVSAEDFWVREAVELTPVPQHQDMNRHQRETANRKAVQNIVREHAASRKKPVGRPETILEQDPLYIPEGVKVSRIERFKAKGPMAEELIRLAKESYRAMCNAHDAAMDAFLAGRRGVKFPENCYVPLLVRNTIGIT